MKQDVDILTLFFQSPDVFTDEYIVDELLDFFGAATQTTQLVTQSMLGHLMTKKESLDEVRGEFSKMVQESADDREADITSLSKNDILRQFLTIDNYAELPFLNQVMMETLRLHPPVPVSSEFTLSKDAKIGKYNIKAADKITVFLSGLHRNANEWQKPNEFIPQRFNVSDPLSLTPTGKKRQAFSWAPWNGGRRICFGKTFAEANLKIVATYMIQHFNLEYVENEKYPDTNSLPKAMIGQSEYPSIPVRLTKNNQ